MSHLCGHGLAIDLPRGWNGAITQRDATCGLSVLHAATVPLPVERADAGGGVIERLSGGDVFVGVLEHEASSAGTGLFAAHGLPLPLSPAWFVPGALQGMRPRQSGAQRFFTLQGRAFGLFVVVGDHSRRARLLRAVNRAVATLQAEPRVGGRS
jgi:hypothetical protein